MSSWFRTVIILLTTAIALAGCSGNESKQTDIDVPIVVDAATDAVTDDSNEPTAPPTPADEQPTPADEQPAPAEELTPPETGGLPALRLVQTQETVVEVWVDNVNGLYALAIEITIDPTKIRVVDTDANQNGIQIAPGEVPSPDFVIPRSETAAEDVIEYIVTQLPPREAFNGTGRVAVINLAEPPIDLSAISIKSFDLSTTKGEPIEVTVQNLKS